MATGNAWLFLTTSNRAHAGHDGYDDQPDTRYMWDDHVANHERVRKGDPVVIWDKQVLLGISSIAQIKNGSGEKILHRCPACGTTKIKARHTKAPKFRCGKCTNEFQEPKSESVHVRTYQADYAQDWVSLRGAANGQELRELCVNKSGFPSPKSQSSIRGIRFDALKNLLNQKGFNAEVSLVTKTGQSAKNGHRTAKVRVRVGQDKFRGELLDIYGSSCAFTGPAPSQSIDACHLYSYAEVGRHDKGGGLLIRKDIHRLFDLGLIKINPVSENIVVDSNLAQFPNYWGLNGQSLRLSKPLSSKQKHWLKLHWNFHLTR